MQLPFSSIHENNYIFLFFSIRADILRLTEKDWRDSMSPKDIIIEEKAIRTIAAMTEFQTIIGEDLGWDSEESMLKDIITIRKKSSEVHHYEKKLDELTSEEVKQFAI